MSINERFSQSSATACDANLLIGPTPSPVTSSPSPAHPVVYSADEEHSDEPASPTASGQQKRYRTPPSIQVRSRTRRQTCHLGAADLCAMCILPSSPQDPSSSTPMDVKRRKVQEIAQTLYDENLCLIGKVEELEAKVRRLEEEKVAQQKQIDAAQGQAPSGMKNKVKRLEKDRKTLREYAQKKKDETKRAKAAKDKMKKKLDRRQSELDDVRRQCQSYCNQMAEDRAEMEMETAKFAEEKEALERQVLEAERETAAFKDEKVSLENEMADVVAANHALRAEVDGANSKMRADGGQQAFTVRSLEDELGRQRKAASQHSKMLGQLHEVHARELSEQKAESDKKISTLKKMCEEEKGRAANFASRLAMYNQNIVSQPPIHQQRMYR